MPPRLITIPAGVLTVPPGVVEVCQAGTSRTQPPSNSTVPPRFGSATFSTPWSPSSSASSTMATHWAPVRLAMSTTSPQWSAWPWVRKMWVGSGSEASTAALGLPLRNGSISTRVSPSTSSKQEWPRKRISTVQVPSVSVVRFIVELTGELPADGHADEHAHAGLLGQQGLDPGGALGLVGLGRSGPDLSKVGVAEPAALVQRLAEDALKLRGERGQAPLGAREPLGVGQRPQGGIHLLVREHRGDTTSGPCAAGR